MEREIDTEKIVRNKITIISFVCSLMVIWIHSFNLYTYGIDNSSSGLTRVVYNIETIGANLTRIAIPFFFFISGFLFYRTFEWGRLKEKYISRIKSILIPYIIWCTVYYLYFVILTNTPYVRDMINTERVPLSVAVWLRSIWPDEYYTLWFLQELMLYVAICPLIYVLQKNRYVSAILLISIILIVQFDLIKLPITGFIYYCTGAHIAIHHKNMESYTNREMSFFSVLFILVMAVSGFRFIDVIPIRLVFFFAVWFILDYCRLDGTFPWWMKITFFSYVAHDVFLELYEKVILMLFGSSPVYALVDYILAPVMCFFTLIAIAALLCKYTPGVWRIITGMR